MGAGLASAGMQPFWRRITALLVALAFLAGGVLGVAATPVAAAEPCPHEYGHESGHQQHQHKQDSGAALCLSCCGLGVCVSVPNLPIVLNVAPAAAVSAVIYWGKSGTFAGLSVAPDPGPPKPIA